METVRACTSYIRSLLSDVGLTTGTLAAAAGTLVVMYNWKIWERHRYPPGPLPLPFIDNILWFSDQTTAMRNIAKLRDKHGEVITFFLMKHKMVVLNSPEAVYQGLVKNADHLSELHPSFQSLIFEEKNLALAGPGEQWQVLRRHLIRALKEHGVGGTGIEQVISEETEHLLAAISPYKGSLLDIHDYLQQAASNVISQIIFGDRFDYSDEKLQTLQFAKFAAAKMKVNANPWLKHLPGDPIGYHREKGRAEKGISFCANQMEQHQRDMNYDALPKDFIESYLHKMKEAESDPTTYFSAPNFRAMVVGLYMAGTDTTSESLYWAVLYMVKYPHVQERMYQEIKEKLGQRKPSYSDRNELPFCMSSLTEITRLSNVGGATRPRLLDTDLTICGKVIPKGTMVIGNLTACMFDPEVFPDPDTFKPERFIDSDGKFQKPQPKNIAIFGIGRRACAGEHLARSELFMFFIALLQRFKLDQDETNPPTLKRQIRLVHSAFPYKIKISERPQ